MRQTIATMKVPPRLLTHLLWPSVREDFMQVGEADTAALRTGCNTSRMPVRADTRMQHEPDNPLTSHKA